MTKVTGGKKRHKDPIYEKIINGEPFSFDEAKELVDTKLEREIKRTDWVSRESPVAEQSKSRLSSVFLAHFIKAKDHKEDMIETLLAHQMVAINNAAMDCIRHATWPGNSTEITCRYLNMATKLLSTFARHAEFLDKRRGKGQQKITVQHQHFNVQSVGHGAIGNFGDAALANSNELKRSDDKIANSTEQPFTIDSEATELLPQAVKQSEVDDA